MKTFVLFVVSAILLVPTLRAEDKKSAPKIIAAVDATNHIDETVVVTGKVAQVTIREKMVYLNMEKPYPRSPLSAVIFAANTNQFGDIEKLKDKNVELSGKIQLFRERAEIVLSGTNQLKIAEKAGGSGDSEKK